MAHLTKQLIVPLVLLVSLLSVIASQGSNLSCKGKLHLCKNMEAACEKLCPGQTCTVECNSCQPICTGRLARSLLEFEDDGKGEKGGDDDGKGEKGGDDDGEKKNEGNDDHKKGEKEDKDKGKDDHDKRGKGGKDGDGDGDDEDKKNEKGGKNDDDKKGKGGKDGKGGDDDDEKDGNGEQHQQPPTITPYYPSPVTPPTPTPSTPSPPTGTPTPPTPSIPSAPIVPPPTPSTPSAPIVPPPTPSTPSPPIETPPSPIPSTPSPPIVPPPTPSTPSPPIVPPPTPSTPSAPIVPPPTPSTPSPPIKTPPSPIPSTPSPPIVTPPTPSTPSTPSPPTQTPPSPTPSTPYPPMSPPMTPPPPSPKGNGPKKSRCMNKKYGSCYYREFVCPSNCPYDCMVDCVTCRPVCSCDRPGAVCQDPRFIGGDGLTFYFHGKKDRDFCLVSDKNLHINAHFIGKRNSTMTRDFTWVQSIAILFDAHQLTLGALKTSTWEDSVDRLYLTFDGQAISIPDYHGARWQSGPTSITRTSDANSVVVEVEGRFKIAAKVVPITQEDSRIHNYGVREDDCLAHLDLGFKFNSLGEEVNGVLGQTYRRGYVSRMDVGAKMAVMGGEREFATSSLFTADCAASRFVGSGGAEESEMAGIYLPSLKCESGIDGQGVVCKR
ncbi:Microtubule-actin cross-linking factor 1, isoforms 6/7 [Linum perenne]